MEQMKKAEGQEHSRDTLERMFTDYNKEFDTNFSTDTFLKLFLRCLEDVKNAQIDILLVVNMFLTGFDTKNLIPCM